MSENAFEDLLGGHSFSGKKEPKTMKELRMSMDVRDMDPDQRKVLLMYTTLNDTRVNLSLTVCSNFISYRLSTVVHSMSLIQLLWPPCGIGQAVIFSSCGFYLLLSIFFS